MTTGIYILKFKGTTKVYVGKSINIENRFRKHIQNLKNNIGSKKLQVAVTQFGIPKLEIILECSVEELYTAEVEAIEIYDSFENGFNSSRGGEDGYWEGLQGVSNPKCKYTREQLIKCLQLLTELPTKSFKEIAEATGVSTNTITNISSGRGHKWLSKEFSESYSILMSRKGERNTRYNKGHKYPDILSPDGVSYTITNLTSFCTSHKLQSTHIAKLLRGESRSCDGWTLVR